MRGLADLKSRMRPAGWADEPNRFSGTTLSGNPGVVNADVAVCRCRGAVVRRRAKTRCGSDEGRRSANNTLETVRNAQASLHPKWHSDSGRSPVRTWRIEKETWIWRGGRVLISKTAFGEWDRAQRVVGPHFALGEACEAHGASRCKPSPAALRPAEGVNFGDAEEGMTQSRYLARFARHSSLLDSPEQMRGKGGFSLLRQSWPVRYDG